VREADQAMYEAKRTGGGRFLLAGSCNGLSGTAATAGTATNKLPTGVS